MADDDPDEGPFCDLIIWDMVTVLYENALLCDPLCCAMVIRIVKDKPIPEFNFLHVTLEADNHMLPSQVDFPAETALLNPDDPRPYTVKYVEPLLGALLLEIDEAKSQAYKDMHIQPLG